MAKRSPAARSEPNTQAHDAIAKATDRLDVERDRTFGAMAMIDVARDSLDDHQHCTLRRVLIDAYSQLDRVVSELQSISRDLSAEVANG